MSKHQHDTKQPLLDEHEQLPEVYNSLHFRSVQDPYRTVASDRMSVYSTLHAGHGVDTMLEGGLERFYEKYKHLSKKVNMHLATPEVRFENLSYTVQAREMTLAEKQGTVGSYFTRMLTPWTKKRFYEQKVLHPMSGIIKPGTMTLILANPGSGKSTFLKALAGKLQNNKTCEVGGEITFSGLKSTEVDPMKIVGLVDQRDNHCPTLTVRETFKFADMCLNGSPESQPEEVREVAKLRTEMILHLLGLSNCADTVVGDALLRGCSGGERKRVTVGEMLVGGQSVFLCDEISTGLDSAATYDIVQSLRTWSKTLGGSVVIALLQPTPEVVELFDDIIMMNEGHLVYHGPRTSILPYFENLGFYCPLRTDPADFLIDVTSGRGKKYLLPEDRNRAIPIHAHEYSKVFFESEMYQTSLKAINDGFNVAAMQDQADFEKMKSVTAIARTKEMSPFALPFGASTMLLLGRQKTLWIRDKPLLWGKLAEAIIVGLCMGAIYYQADTKYFLRMLFFACAVFQRQAWQQITIAYALREIFYKQRARNFYRTLSYTIAESVVQMPVNLAVSLLMTTFFYFMSGLSPNAGTFIVFVIICVCFQHAICAYMTMLSSLSPSITIGQTLAAFSVCFFLLFSGNIILTDLIPSYWTWMFWFNPLAWGLRAVVVNEFRNGDYPEAVRKANLESVQMTQFGTEYVAYGIIVLVAYYFLFTGLNTLVLHFIRYERRFGVSGGSKVGEDEDDSVYVEVQTPGGTMVKQDMAPKNTGLSFIPANLCIRNLDYYVTLPTKVERQLLNNVSAHFQPGTMTALMGATGAGKTTLMDVIAGRKTGGRIVGDIIINGEPKNPANFSRITAYCEQMDIHSEMATIGEALWFSANLRLPEDITYEEKRKLVTETLDLLELNGIINEQVGHLSVEQKKRVTIGVEVVANPSILFLDEPTSGLDARSATIVMKGVQSIARTGRTVLCTIHQPSITIFELFDSLLLLQRGGFTAYFGELGRDSQKLLEYFVSIPGTEEIRPQYNPATYMLEVTGAGIGRDTKDYSVEYAKSELCARNFAETQRLCQPSPDFVAFSTVNYTPMATGLKNQLKECIWKAMQTYWRSPSYNFVRLASFPWFAIVFGTTFWQLDRITEAQIKSHVGLIYNSMDFIGIIHLMTVLDITCLERAVFYRERMSNYYGPLPYSLSLFFSEIPYLIVAVSCFVVLEFFMVGWESSYFFFFLLTFFLYTSVCTFVGQWMCALCPNTKVANVAVGAISCVFNLFSGFLLPFPGMKSWYSWIQYVVPSSYSLRALAVSQLGICNEDGSGNACDNVNGTQTSVAKYVQDNFQFNPDERWYYVLVLAGMWVILQVCIYLTFKYVSHLKR
ncbi:hypothetical protein SPRG_00123 [Saprolegnia parasitica CBS 223.65]|uniref:ABC transporter domain-containing protein n=1 Tax=Saprolegnia parasitica (strain CBS 223.65) TaxID=695850 RepID=A0A067D9G1_SAPPC|nr:hypothetical protein SPRG_00123 [Saprolegnia parasitica CBS 223.65]KDO35276.1 hypothetical protein SPRG_00123 [Saprolegnia parasitica CBS 223.65]|eukprot:XP_012193626.1 hypothetical protein SPRG_00123 [Saprolegnia parasitica CBS 223.65]